MKQTAFKEKMTRKEFVEYLNVVYSTRYSFEQVASLLGYMKVSVQVLREHYDNQSIGQLFRKQDPVSFNIAFDLWNTRIIKSI